MPETATRSDKLRQAHDKLQDAIAEIVSGDDWKRMLQIASKFHRSASTTTTWNRPRTVLLRRLRPRAAGAAFGHRVTIG